MNTSTTPLPPAPPATTTDRQGAMRRLGCGSSRLAELTAAGELRSVKVGARRLYFLDSLDRYLEEHAEGGAVESP